MVHQSNAIKVSCDGIQERIPSNQYEIQEEHGRKNIPDYDSIAEDLTVAHQKETHHSKTSQQKLAGQKKPRAQLQTEGHDGIDFVSAPIQKMKRHEAVDDRKDYKENDNPHECMIVLIHEFNPLSVRCSPQVFSPPAENEMFIWADLIAHFFLGSARPSCVMGFSSQQLPGFFESSKPPQILGGGRIPQPEPSRLF